MTEILQALLLGQFADGNLQAIRFLTAVNLDPDV
jgi:hypothetical protein